MSGISPSRLLLAAMKEEKYYRMQQQYLYVQQLQNQGFTPQVEENGNSMVRPPTRTAWQPFSNKPVQNEAESGNKVPCRNWSAVCGKPNAPEYPLMGRGCHCCAPDFYVNGENCSSGHEQKQTSQGLLVCGCHCSYSSPTHLVKDFEAVRISDKVGKLAYPGKLLTRSQGLNSLRHISPGSISDHGLQNYANTGGRDAVFRHQLSVPNTGPFQLRDCSGDADASHGNSRIQPHKFNSVDEVTGRIYN